MSHTFLSGTSGSLRRLLVGSLFVFLLAACGKSVKAGPPNGLSALENEFLDETNKLRMSPQSFIPELEKIRGSFKGEWLTLPDLPPVRTQEGAAVVQETIDFLRQAKPVPPLSLAPPLVR